MVVEEMKKGGKCLGVVKLMNVNCVRLSVSFLSEDVQSSPFSGGNMKRMDYNLWNLRFDRNRLRIRTICI